MGQDVYLPNGAKLAISKTMDVATTISDVSNTNPAIAASTAHGYSEGGILLLTSDWSDLNSRVARVVNPETNSYGLERINTTSLTKYPAEFGAGTARLITDWTAIDGVMNPTGQGGEQQYWPYAPLEASKARNIPTEKSPQSWGCDLADPEDSDDKEWFDVLTGYDEDGSTQVLRITFKSGALIYIPVIVSFNRTPRMNRNEGAAVRLDLAFQADVTRYPSSTVET
jgi:hypothetical protein